MQGALGIGSDLNHWTAEDFDLAKQMIAYYKSIRETVQNGNLHRLLSLREGEVAANEFVSRDGKQAVVFAFLHSQQFLYPAPTVYLRGLDPAAVYRVKRIDGKLTDPQESLSGGYLMNHGLNFNLEGDFDGTSVELEKVD